MDNKEKEKWIAQQDPQFFNNLPSNYHKMMDAISELPDSVAIGKPKKILKRAADPAKGLGEAGILVFEPGEGVKAHTHTTDSETYTFEDGTQQRCGIGETHEITPMLKKSIVQFDKHFENDCGREL